MTQYLAPEEVLVIHARIVDATGGSHGVRDVGAVASLCERPKMEFGGTELYPTLFHKAAAYFESCAMHHVFVDGNKRTAAAIAARFLYLNDYDLTASNAALEKFVIDAVVKKYDIGKIAAWFKKHSRKKAHK
jgi:death-on-curing protein